MNGLKEMDLYKRTNSLAIKQDRIHMPVLFYIYLKIFLKIPTVQVLFLFRC